MWRARGRLEDKDEAMVAKTMENKRLAKAKTARERHSKIDKVFIVD
jgi:hypothetical protein